MAVGAAGGAWGATGKLPAPRGCGGTGRRARFRSVWARARGGSTPLSRITEPGGRSTSRASAGSARSACGPDLEQPFVGNRVVHRQADLFRRQGGFERQESFFSA